MKKLLVIFIIALIPSFVFATTTTATIGGTLKVYETLSLGSVVDMVWPAQYAGSFTGTIFTNTNQPSAAGITGTNTQGKAGKVQINGTAGTQFTPSLGAFSFTAGPSGFATLNAITTVKICTSEPMSGAAECTNPGVQTLPGTAGTPGVNMSLYVQGKIIGSATALNAGNYTGTVTFTATY